jgi:hypothetical protein
VRERRDFMSESFQILMAGNNRAGLRGQPYSISVEKQTDKPSRVTVRGSGDPT